MVGREPRAWLLSPQALHRASAQLSLCPGRSNGVYGAKAERVRQLGPAARRRWKVRRELLYQWQSSGSSTRGACDFEPFDREAFCRAVAGRNVVVVGDAFSLDFHDALLNHVVTAATKAEAGTLGDAW